MAKPSPAGPNTLRFRAVRVVLPLMAFLLVPAMCASALQPPQPAAPPAVTAPAAPQSREEQPAEKAFKNIKALTGMPAAQMLPVMHLMRASLGVRCDFCHATEEDKFELDTKKEKETARQMIRMVLEINKNNFEGRSVVTCNTCHQGKEHPVRVPPIGQGLFADTTRGDPEAAPREKLPEPAAILDRYIAALGGRAALEAVQSRISRGTLLHLKVVDPGTPKARAVNRGQEDPLEIVQRAPNKITVTVGPPSQQIVQSFDGVAGTIRTPRGERAMTPQEIARVAANADLHRELALRDRADKARAVGKDQIDGHEVILVRIALDEGVSALLAFDAQTGLLRRQTVNRPTFLGPDPEQTEYDDYRDVGGVKVPFLVKASYVDDNHLGVTRKLTEVRNGAAP
jgi:photosynthetic reaction center cytochrome c subunit